MRCVYRKGELEFVNMMVVDLPSPTSLSYFWGFGSLLGVFFMVQVISGLFLSMRYVGSIEGSFDSIINIMRDVSWGWFVRIIHSNGASCMFAILYIHIGRGLYYGSYISYSVWMSGVSIFLLSMAIAFLGYVLPWGQMSFWAATVITNLLSALPYIGGVVVEWVWGGFSVGGATLTRFFSMHFLFPFVMMVVVFFHLLFLHQQGSGSVVGVSSSVDSVIFYPYYVWSDVVGFLVGGFFLVFVSLWVPFIFMDVENFIPANSMVTPVHIQPEWYFLFAYAILRSVPSSVGGVVALVMSVFVLYLMPFFSKVVIGLGFDGGFLLWVFVAVWGMLTWCGSCVVEYPFVVLSQVFSVLYFLMYIVVCVWVWVRN